MPKKKSATFWIVRDCGEAVIFRREPILGKRIDGGTEVHDDIAKLFGGALTTRARKLTVTWKD